MEIEVRYMVMAPASYVYFNNERVVDGTLDQFAVPENPPAHYNNWAKGLGRLYVYHKTYNVTPEAMINAYPSKKILYLVGSEDCNENDPSMGMRPASMLQGKSRRQRAVVYYNYLVHFFGDRIKASQHLHIVDGAGHSGRTLMLSPAAVAFAFAPYSKPDSVSQTETQTLCTFGLLTKGVESLGNSHWRFSAIAPLKTEVVPLFWGDHKAYAGDARWPQNSYPPVAVAGEYQKGRFVALGHDGLMIDPTANDQFTDNILKWLGRGYAHKKVIIYTSIGRWFGKDKLSVKAKELFAAGGVEVSELSSALTDEDLAGCDLLMMVRPSRRMTDCEVRSIVSYVGRGGSVLMTGVGWLWDQRKGVNDFPLNPLGQHLGFEYSGASIDQTPQRDKDGIRRCSTVRFQPLSERRPIEVKTIAVKEHDNRFIGDDVARNKDNRCHYVLEGEHVMVSMPYGFWVKCRKPADFITQLDRVYELYADLTDGVKPFYGRKILILNLDHMSPHMCSGNPILSRQDRMDYILEELEKSDYKNPSWGLMHELAHDFIIGMKHRFVFGNGDNESWAEFVALYGCQTLGLEHKEPTWLAAAMSYHESGEQDFGRIKNNAWLMVGFLHHIQKQYGWENV